MDKAHVSAPLDISYAAGRPLLGARRVRTFIVSAAVLALSLSVICWGRPAWNKVQLLYWQGRCMKYEAPAGQVFFGLPDFNRLSEFKPPVPPSELNHFYRLAGFGAGQTHGTVFVHERTSPAGNRRLVAVDAHAFGCMPHVSLTARVFVPASLFSWAREVTGGERSCSMDFPSRFSATWDRNDSAHFVINFTAHARPCVIDGWLTDDDRVILEERKPALAAVTP